MKLAELVSKIEECQSRLSDLELLIPRSSSKDISVLLEEYGNLLVERQKFIFARERIEISSNFSGSSLKELNLLVLSLDDRVQLLRRISKREDLSEKFLMIIFSQLDLFSKTKSQLQASLQKLSWEIDVPI